MFPSPAIRTGNLLDPSAPMVFSLLPGPATDDPLRKLLPAPVIAALDTQCEQMKLLVIEPLLVCEPADLEKRFTELHDRFLELYLSGTLLVLATIGDLAPFASITPHAFQASEDLIRSNIELKLGSDIGNTVLRALKTLQRVVTGAIKAITNSAVRSRENDAHLTELAHWTIACFQAVTCVLWALNGRISIPIRPENLARLAQWSANYASGCYAIARDSGLLSPATAVGPLPEPDPEDVELANAGMEDYAELLAGEESE